MGKIWVLADIRQGQIRPITYELIAGAQEFAENEGHDIEVILPCPVSEDILSPLSHVSVHRIIVLNHSSLSTYTPTRLISALRTLITHKGEPTYIFVPHTHRFYDFTPRISALFESEPITDIHSVHWENGKPFFKKQVFYGKYMVTLGLSGTSPYILSFQNGVFDGENVKQESQPAVETFDITELDEGKRESLEFKEPERGGVDLENAEIIVAVGRGIGKKENLALIEELAELLGAAIGSSRPIVDAGWLPYEHQIGSSGQIVHPKLYIGLGISGAMQHIVGMKNSKCIVAINKDSEAPIFKLAHYGIVEDLFKVVPVLIEKLKELREKGEL